MIRSGRWRLVRIVTLIAITVLGNSAQERKHACASCHPKQVAGYQRTAMARSLFRPQQQPSGRFTHAFSATRFAIRSNGSNMWQHLERDGLEAEYKVEFVIGSGNHAFGYLIQIKDYLFQSPVSFYSKRAAWDVAPGYERDHQPDFTRPVTL